MVNLTSLTGFYTSQVVRRISSINSTSGHFSFDRPRQRGLFDPARADAKTWGRTTRKGSCVLGRGFLVLNLARENFSIPKGKARLSRCFFLRSEVLHFRGCIWLIIWMILVLGDIFSVSFPCKLICPCRPAGESAGRRT